MKGRAASPPRGRRRPKSEVRSPKSEVRSPKARVRSPKSADAALRTPKAQGRKPKAEGWHGWDEYAAFYDWENRQTMGRRDVVFWQDMARRYGGPILELGCGTGRVSLPVARTGTALVGVDRSDRMLAYARRRLTRVRVPLSLSLVRADIRQLPFKARSPFTLVMAPYGILQSLLDEDDLMAALRSVARVSRPGTIFGVDLVSDVPAWDEYRRRVRMRGTGAGGSQITLVESVRQEPQRKLTIFDQEYIERRGSRRRVRRFSLAFRTLPLPDMLSRLESAGFVIEALLGDYDGRPWDIRADVWLILARKI
jgi:ubiquinone/menaquinone biosynthesis C-methylase UbiE